VGVSVLYHLIQQFLKTSFCKDESMENMEIAEKLKSSLEKRLKDIRGARIDIDYRGEAIFWRYGACHGRMKIIGEAENGTILLQLPEGFDTDSHPFQTISSMKSLIKIYNRIEGYLLKHGEKEYPPFQDPVYHLRNGIPD